MRLNDVLFLVKRGARSTVGGLAIAFVFAFAHALFYTSPFLESASAPSFSSIVSTRVVTLVWFVVALVVLTSMFIHVLRPFAVGLMSLGTSLQGLLLLAAWYDGESTRGYLIAIVYFTVTALGTWGMSRVSTPVHDVRQVAVDSVQLRETEETKLE